jgi:DNA-binding protein HU-beta
MELKEIAAQVSTTTGVRRGDVVRVCDALFEAIKNSVLEGQKVGIPGLGSFVLKEREAGERVNEKTGEKRAVDAARYPMFRPSRTLMGKAKKKKSAKEGPSDQAGKKGKKTK